MVTAPALKEPVKNAAPPVPDLERAADREARRAVGAPDAKAGAMKPSAEPSSGAPVVTGGLPAARVAASACTWLGGRPRKPIDPGPSQSSISPASDATP
jgi:hypothetical protein